MPRYDVFLSHASADKPAVEHLARKLREAGVEPFLDSWHLVGGQPWQEALEEAIAQSSTCIVFFGPVSKGGAWRNEETRLALVRAAQDASFRVIPVLLPDSRTEEVSGFLSLRTWVDLRAGLDDEDAFGRLVAGIRGAAPGAGAKPALPYRSLAPARESFVRRREYEEAVQALLGSHSTLALQGAGGFGKTSLAVEICYDPRIHERFPDGILWAQMRDNLDSDGRLKEIRDLLRRWTREEPPAFETVAKAGQHLIELLNGKRVLLVVDDIWNPEDVTPFQGLSAESSLLVTTRNSRTLPAETVRIRVDAMKTSEAAELLGREIQKDGEKRLERLSARLGEWPLLLKIVNRQLRELVAEGLSTDQAMREVEEAIEAEGLTAFDREESRHQAVKLTVEVSLGRLSAEDSARFDQLAIFPEDEDIPLSVLASLWEVGSFQVKRLCDRLYELSLLLRFDRPGETIRLHDVVRAYLLRKVLKEIPAIHRRFLESHRPANGTWADLPPTAAYLWRNLAHHMTGAGEGEAFKDLLANFDFLRSKIAASGVNALLADYGVFKDDPEIRFLGDALRLSSNVLAKYPEQLREQLWGRLLDRGEFRIQRLLQSAKEKSSTSWLQPRMASFAKPGGALIRTIDHPGIPEMLAVLDDGRVISSSTDRTLRIWDLESGQMLRIIVGESICAVAVSAGDRLNRRNPKIISGSFKGGLRTWDPENERPLLRLERQAPFISALAGLDDGRVISGAMDRALRVWNLESGEELMALKGHTGGITAIAVLDSRRVVSGSVDGSLRVWEVDTGRTLAVLEGHAGPARAVAVLDGRRVVSGWANGTVQVWDVESGEPAAVLAGHSGEVNAVAVLPDGRVVSGSADRTLRLWDAGSGQTLAVLEGHFNEVKAVAALAAQRFVSASADRTLRVWDLAALQPGQASARHIAAVTAVTALDERRAVSGSEDKTLRIWDVASGQTLGVLEGHVERVTTLATLDPQRVISGSPDGRLRVWDIDSGQPPAVLGDLGAEVLAVAVVDGRRIVSGSWDGTLRLWDLETGEALAVLQDNPADLIYEVAVLDRRRVLSGSYDGKLRLWDLDTGESITLFHDESASLYALALLDARRVVSATSDGMLRVHDIDTAQVLAELKEHSATVLGLVLLDDLRLVSGSHDRTLRVWNLETGATECLVALDAPVLSVAVVPGSRILIAGDASGRVHFFDFVGGEGA